MAMYHFRIKSDKKPNGTKISAVQHVEYINREGKFSTPEQWQQKNEFGGDFISSKKFSNTFDEQNILLYKTDDYGSIRNTARGIEVTQNASEETIAIALVLAAQTMDNQPLVLHGSDEFKKEALKTAVLKDLPISFDDLSFQRDFIHYKCGDYPDRKNLPSILPRKFYNTLRKLTLSLILNISIVKKHMKIAGLVFFIPTTCRNGRRTTRRNSFKPQTNMKASGIAGMSKLNLLYLMS